MKKTIIITLAMLIVFGGAVMFGAGRVSDQWQTPQQDKTNIEIKPVIDKVEEEIESYPYVKSEDQIITDGMVTHQDAAYSSGTTIEYFWPDLNMKDKVASTDLNNRFYSSEGRVSMYHIYYRCEDEEYLVSYVDPYTAQVIYTRRDEKDYWGNTVEMIDGICVSEPPIDNKAVDVLLEKTLEHTAKLGYTNCTEYAVTRDTMGVYTEKSAGAAIYVVTIKTDDNTVLEFAYYDNEKLDYPLNVFSNETKTVNDFENLPQLSPIPQ